MTSNHLPQGFPLEKSIQYAKLRDPLVINNLESQFFIMDRREVYRILSEEGIDLPRYAILNRDRGEEEQFEEQVLPPSLTPTLLLLLRMTMWW